MANVADNPPPRVAMQNRTTTPKIKQTALIFLCKCSLQQCYLIETTLNNKLETEQPSHEY
jgi:hypothetical protein